MCGSQWAFVTVYVGLNCCNWFELRKSGFLRKNRDHMLVLFIQWILPLKRKTFKFNPTVGLNYLFTLLLKQSQLFEDLWTPSLARVCMFLQNQWEIGRLGSLHCLFFFKICFYLCIYGKYVFLPLLSVGSAGVPVGARKGVRPPWTATKASWHWEPDTDTIHS